MHPTVQKYQEAWEQRNPTLLAALFAPDAIYQYRPWKAARGLREIERYWEDKVVPQANVRFEVLRECVCGNELWLEWKAVVGLPGTEPSVSLVGVMILDLDSNLCIKKLTEYYFKTDKSS
ncbi:MAG: nuclear transport factor 2 family protein [Verrucomicrobia bacterium]|nr:nuclear transport factor 2 family protein [Verrucomicrobiota bacterium]